MFATMIKDTLRGVSRSFGLVTMPTAAEVQAAIVGLMGNELLGQSMNGVR
jgi:hypothetical protein